MAKKKASARKASSKKGSAKKSSTKKAAAKKTGSKRSAKSQRPASNAAARKKTASKKSAKKAAKKSVGRVRRASGRKVVKKPTKAGKMVYYFGSTRTDGDGTMRALLGGKGANLADMTRIGLPVPPGLTITTDTCAKYNAGGGRLPIGLMKEVTKNMVTLEREMGKKFGDTKNPLLVSVRSGAAVSMPGMMDTVLNLGLTDESVVTLAEATGNRRFAYDAYRRLINMFGEVVMGLGHEHFEHAFAEIKSRYHAADDTDVPEDGLVDLCQRYKEVYRERTGSDFPQDPLEQLELAIEAVFKSWDSARAVSYRQKERIVGLNGTAVNVQAMVYGNMGDTSGTGVAFTRNPSTGENKFFGEFLINAQGEDVVAGIRTPLPAIEMKKWNAKVYGQLLKIKATLEKHYKDMQDIEFTIEQGKLYMLQTRTGKRAGAAAVKIACDMVKEGMFDEKAALLRIPAGDLIQLLLPYFDPTKRAITRVLAKGLPASPGASVGKPAFTAEEAVERTHAGEKVILVRNETSPEDVDGMHSAVGILTSTGGMTSHAAVVARGWGKCCVAGASEIQIDAQAGQFTVDGRTYTRSDTISIDGSTGEVLHGAVPTVEPEGITGDFAKVMRWADKYSTLRVRTNADTPRDAQRARDFGAKGIGLCRTEHMFFEGPRLKVMREMIIAETLEQREAALEQLLPYQRNDFVGIFRAMDGLPVTIRLLDPPLHEFLPNERDSLAGLAESLGVSEGKLRRRVAMLHELNPMLGHRGCRLAVTYPEILRMQVRAIVEATIKCVGEKVRAVPEIMIPLVGTASELAFLRDIAEQTIETVKVEMGFKRRLDIKIGTMIEIPRAALTASEVAERADFFSFGTNDLTQLTFGYSRDDANTFLPHYIKRGILEVDPFQSLDQTGVGKLIEFGVEHGRGTNDGLKLGICGEHGGDPASVDFCHRVGLDYVSCSPFRVPIARLAAAQAAIRHG